MRVCQRRIDCCSLEKFLVLYSLAYFECFSTELFNPFKTVVGLHRFKEDRNLHPPGRILLLLSESSLPYFCKVWSPEPHSHMASLLALNHKYSMLFQKYSMSQSHVPRMKIGRLREIHEQKVFMII